jgi:VWA domain-containing protein
VKQCIARTKGFERCKNSVEGGHILFCRRHRWWWLIALFSALGFIIATLAGISQIIGTPFIVTKTPTSTITLTLTSSPTLTWTPSLQPASLSHYYMIVLDASVNMQESFDGQSKWGAALISLSSMLEALNRNSNYGLVVVGGSNANTGIDPCKEPSAPIIPFESGTGVLLPSNTLQMNNLITQINQLQPTGGGSLYAAFSLAKKQLEDLPANAVKTMIFITGSNDTCESRDEWRDLERVIQLPDLVGLYSEIIILDEHAGLISQNIAERINSLSETVNVQVSQNNQQLQQITGNVIAQINTHVEEQQLILEVSPPENPTSVTPPTSTSQVIVVIQPSPTAKPPTPIPPTSTLIPTATLFPEILSILSPQNNVALNCSSQGDCIINVSIQWIPDSQRQGRNLSVWVRPIPDQPDGSGQDYWSQNPPQHTGNGIWQVSGCVVGQMGDANGLSFAIYAIVTNEYYSSQVQVTTLPSNLNKTSVNVTRGNP